MLVFLPLPFLLYISHGGYGRTDEDEASSWPRLFSLKTMEPGLPGTRHV